MTESVAQKPNVSTSRATAPAPWLVLAWLTVLEVLTFGKGISGAWFYLDDWTMLHGLHFAPKSFFACLLYTSDAADE